MFLIQLSTELHFGATLYRRAASEQKKRSDLALFFKKESRFQPFFGKRSSWRAVFGKTALFSGVELSFFLNMIMKNKVALPHKRVQIFKITLQESHFGSFFLSAAITPMLIKS